ncbi:MAG: 3-dehydroquinate synthase [Desulfobacterales bacterium]
MARTIHVKGHEGPSAIIIGERIDRLNRYLPEGCQVALITDKTVHGLYGRDFPAGEIILVGQGEAGKTLETVSGIYRQLMHMGADRSTFVVGIGGGVVCDVAGFTASTYMRGLRFGFAATTLLAQVDASVGGKNGVNVDGYKNMVGVFRQPEFVLCDTSLLRSLPAVEIRSGFGEIVKHAAIASRELFEFLEARWDRALSLDAGIIDHLIGESVRIKADVVDRDETEQGERRKLNFGHTIGHAVERALGIAHGEAVSIGMHAAARLSVKQGLLDPREAGRLERLLSTLNLPIRADIDPRIVLDGVLRDKKRERDEVRFVLLEEIGKAVVTPIEVQTLSDFIHEIF